MKSVIMSDRNKMLLAVVPLLFGKENHSYCMRHLTNNLIGEASKLGIRRNTLKKLVQDMFNRVYATTATEYESTWLR